MEVRRASTLCDQEDALDVLNLLQQSVALIGVYDQNEVLRYTNEAFRRAYYIDPNETLDWQTLMRRNFLASRGTIIKTDDIDAWISSVRSRRGKSKVRSYESDLHDGRFIWVTETMREDGWITYVGADVSQLNKSQRDLRLDRDALFRQSFTDELTGVSNRRHVLCKLGEIIDSKQDAWVCIIDIDHFKRINDTYGHQAGDDTLVCLAQTVRKSVQLQDVFGRIGGEEFLLIFVNQPLKEVRKSLQRLQETIRGLMVCDSFPELRITMSGGLTQIGEMDTQERILARADYGLYCAKASGRDQFRVSDSEDSFHKPEPLC